MARVSGTLGGVLLVITAIGVLFAPQVATVFTPGAVDEPHKFALTVELLRLTFPFLLFVSLTALSGGALNSFHRFGLPALTPVILNLCMIAGALVAVPASADADHGDGLGGIGRRHFAGVVPAAGAASARSADMAALGLESSRRAPDHAVRWCRHCSARRCRRSICCSIR